MPFKTLVNGAVSLWGQHQTNKNIDKQLRAQALENEKNRQYNLSLAIKQNKWNLQQWSRENAYNSPIAQMRRMEAAGLNPDMMYGGGVSGNLSASSPSMTSGAPSSPMDWSALSSKRTVLDSLLATAQLEQIEATTDKIKSETKGQNISNNIQSFETEVLDLMREEGYQGTIAYARASYQDYEAKLKHKEFQSESAKFNYLIDELEHDKAVREFTRSLHPQQREMFEAAVREAVATANIKVYLDKMKALDFWTDKGMDAIQSVVGVIGAAGKFKNPMEVIESYSPKGYSKTVKTTK